MIDRTWHLAFALELICFLRNPILLVLIMTSFDYFCHSWSEHRRIRQKTQTNAFVYIFLEIQLDFCRLGMLTYFGVVDKKLSAFPEAELK